MQLVERIKFMKKRKILKILLIIGAVSILLIMILFGVYLMGFYRPGKPILFPDYPGSNEDIYLEIVMQDIDGKENTIYIYDDDKIAEFVENVRTIEMNVNRFPSLVYNRKDKDKEYYEIYRYYDINVLMKKEDSDEYINRVKAFENKVIQGERECDYFQEKHELSKYIIEFTQEYGVEETFQAN